MEPCHRRTVGPPMADVLHQPGASGAQRKAREPRKDSSTGAARCRRKFLKYFPEGFRDEDYLSLERNYKVKAQERWLAGLAEPDFKALLDKRAYEDIPARAL